MTRKILLVDDDFDTRYMLTLMLKSEGYEVITAGDGECALAVAAEQRPDLLITDVSMPRLNGIELVRRLRQQPETAALPVLAITAYGQMTIGRVIEAGASACLRKPLEFDEFVPAVKKLLAP